MKRIIFSTIVNSDLAWCHLHKSAQNLFFYENFFIPFIHHALTTSTASIDSIIEKVYFLGEVPIRKTILSKFDRLTYL